MDDFSNSALFVPDNFSYSAPELPGGWSLSQGLKDAATTAADLFSSGFGLVNAVDTYNYNRQARSLDLLKQSAAIDISRTMTGAQVDIAKLQASGAVKIAQRQEAQAGTDPNLSTIMGNINARIAGMTSGNSLMLWLTVAGVGIAAMQFFKGRR